MFSSFESRTSRGERANQEIARADALIDQAREDLAPAARMPLMVGFMYGTEVWVWG